MMIPYTSQVARQVEVLFAAAIRTAADLLSEGRSRMLRIDRMRRNGFVDDNDLAALSRVVQRRLDMLRGRLDPVAPYRPQPREEDGLGNGAIKLPFVVADTNAPVSLTDEVCAGGIAIIGALQSGKTVRAVHIVKAFLDAEKTVVGFVSKGVSDWHFVARDGYPVLFLTVGGSSDD